MESNRTRRNFIHTAIISSMVVLAGCSTSNDSGGVSQDQPETSDSDGSADDKNQEMESEPDPIYGDEIESNDILDSHKEEVDKEIDRSRAYEYEEFVKPKDGENYDRLAIFDSSGRRYYKDYANYSDYEDPFVSETFRTSDGDVYRRDKSETEGRVIYQDNPHCYGISMDRFYNMSGVQLSELLDSAVLSYNDTRRENDEWIHVYSVDSIQLVNEEYFEYETDIFKSELYINNDGLIKKVNVENDHVIATNEYSETSSLNEPDWLTEADHAEGPSQCE